MSHRLTLLRRAVAATAALASSVFFIGCAGASSDP